MLQYDLEHGKYNCVVCGRTLKGYEIELYDGMCNDCHDTYKSKAIDEDTTQNIADDDVRTYIRKIQSDNMKL